MEQEIYGTSIKELAWYWSFADAAVGFGAQDVNNGSSASSTEKAAASHDRRIRTIEGFGRPDYVRKKRVELVRSKLELTDDLVLRLAFEPVSEHKMGGAGVCDKVRDAFTRKGINLFMVAVYMGIAAREYVKAEVARAKDREEEIVLADVELASTTCPNRVRSWLHKLSESSTKERVATRGRIASAAEECYLESLATYDRAYGTIRTSRAKVREARYDDWRSLPAAAA